MLVVVWEFLHPVRERDIYTVSARVKQASFLGIFTTVAASNRDFAA